MKGLATQTIVLLILALIVLGILGGLIFIGGGPFRCAAEYNACKGKLLQWCASGTSTTYTAAMEGCLDNNKWTKCGVKPFDSVSGIPDTAPIKGPCDPDTEVCCP